MPRYENQSRSDFFPAAFRPAEPSPDLDFLVGKWAELNRKGAPRVLILGAVSERTGVRLFCKSSSQNTGWFPLDEIDLLEEQPERLPPIDVFG